ncbi:MAG: hypothetical protein WC027_02200 [Candidatus Paceibacterota bacterium]
MSEKLESIPPQEPKLESGQEPVANKPWVKSRLARFLGIGAVTASTLLGVPQYQKIHYANEVKTAGENLGMNLEEFARNMKVNVTLEVYDKEANQYIVHIGQVHHLPGMEVNNPELASEVIDSQLKISQILDTLVKVNNGTTNIFVEGVLDTSLDLLSVYKEKVQNIRSVTADKDSYRKIYNDIWVGVDENRGLGTSAEALFAYVLNQELPRLEKEFRNNPPQLTVEEKVDFDKYERELRDLRKKVYDKHGDSAIYLFLGATAKAYFDGTVNLLPTEGETRQEMNKKASEIGEVYYDNVDERKRRSPIRESETIDIIGGSVTDNQKVIPVVFGEGHNFADDVIRHNGQHPDQRFNLIKIETGYNI